MSETDYGLKEMNEKRRWNVIIEVDNVTREELRWSDYIMMRYKLITEHLSLSLNIFFFL